MNKLKIIRFDIISVLTIYRINQHSIFAQSAMINISARHSTSLNGKWNIISDPTGIGNWRQVWKEPKAEKKTDFFEYSFDGDPVLNVPGDFNTQLPELTYVEGASWYKRSFEYNHVLEK